MWFHYFQKLWTLQQIVDEFKPSSPVQKERSYMTDHKRRNVFHTYLIAFNLFLAKLKNF